MTEQDCLETGENRNRKQLTSRRSEDFLWINISNEYEHLKIHAPENKSYHYMAFIYMNM